MKRIEEYEKEIQSAASGHFNRHSGSGVMYLCGKSGMGKTLLARQYVKNHGGIYFSFRNLDAAFAPRIFFPDCSNWDSFFQKILETKNRPVIFFDDMDDRNDKDIFLERLPVLKGKAFVVLIYRNESQIPAKARKLTMKPITPPDLCREYKKLEQRDALRIIAMTDGIPALVDLFRLDLSFEENIQNIFVAGSPYLQYTEENLRREFRSPESYNTLLYGLSIGYNRISQLAEFSGYPKNKCDKYLKALDAAGYIEKEQKRDEAGTVRTHYCLKGGYLRVWYQLYFPRQHEFIDPLSKDDMKDLVFWIDDCATKYYFRKLCWRWFSRNASGFYGDGSVASENPAQRDITINGVQIDFIQHGKDRDLYMKIWDDPESGFPKELFQKIEKATTTKRPFYDNIYFLFSIGRVCNYVEELRKLGTVSIVELRSFFGRNNAEHFKDI